jgi:hypothetical protein
VPAAVYAWALMTNHAHIIIEQWTGGLGEIHAAFSDRIRG